MGISMETEVIKRGFYPQGGGIVKATIWPCLMPGPLCIEERGPLEGIVGTAFSQNLPGHVAQRMIMSAEKELSGTRSTIRPIQSVGSSTGAGIFLFAKYRNTVLGADSLGERGVSSERVGEEAAHRLLEEMGGKGTLDAHTADQIITYMALASGPSSFTVRDVTEHLRTQIWLVQRFLDVDIRTKRIDAGMEIVVHPNRTSPVR